MGGTGRRAESDALGLLAGALADRRGARMLLAAADTGRVTVLATLATAVALGWATITLVVTAAFLLGVGEGIRDTAARLVTYGCTALGALAGGALAASAGIEAPFVFSGVVAVAATIAWWLASRPARPPGPRWAGSRR
ncbi:hypothetical protein GCM10011608_48510 [Micromonospora sonchi]|uniref:Uncharacterized protein n=1 Tax=Micromonospora sonchi TaxID=1763543 RepID=A0A917U6M7_9ACTN|nr:hypothetical protein GCM10011608_48510 [Micromonospora sonchi]